MVFKLVRVDSTEPCKIKLPVGTHDIGRGKFLFENEFDNKVSRKHAELLVTADEVTLTALHSNPCFFMKKQHRTLQILNKDSSIVLGCGDKFGILPHVYWYELIFCAQLPEESEPAKDVNKESDDMKKEADEDLAKEFNFDLNETDQQAGEPSSHSIFLERDSPTQLYEWRKTPTPDSEVEKEVENAQNKLKRPLTPDKSNQDELKKAKTEDDTADEAGPSNKPSTSDDKADDGTNVRERCMYGASCYRKNPQHLSQYSHPSDGDWAAGARRTCEWGAACRRRDPRHRRDCSHPPPAGDAPQLPQPPLQRDARGKKKTKRNDDSPPLLVTGKRERKIVKMEVWNGSESEGEPDPYGTDESDEWQPSGELTDTQSITPDWD